MLYYQEYVLIEVKEKNDDDDDDDSLMYEVCSFCSLIDSYCLNYDVITTHHPPCCPGSKRRQKARIWISENKMGELGIQI
eukprot:scaffold4368_cov180-Ochromonas_danica.AAC.22